MNDRATEGRRGPSLGTQVLIGVLLGAACGLFFGDLCAPLEVAGEIYVGLLQMTVLPYVILSLVGRIGSLSIPEAGRLARGAGLTLLAFWGLTLVTVLTFPLALPEWDAGSFFSPSLVEAPEPLNLVELYIPNNLFQSLVNDVVPAVVLFSICLGIALIPIQNKDRLLVPLEVARSALGRITGFVVRLSPYGTFALTAHVAGVQSGRDLLQIQAYLVLYTLAGLFMALVILPMLVSAITPVRYRDLMSEYRAVGLTAFAVGKLFAVLTMIIETVERILSRHDVPAAESRASADLYVPLGYSFPNAGRLLTLLFIPFAAWFSGQPLGPGDYPLLLTAGALSLFGSPLAAMPFLLHAMRLPNDLFPLFLLSGIWCTRVGDLVGAMHLLSFTLIGSAATAGQVRLRVMPLLRWIAITSVIGVLLIAGMRAALAWSLAGSLPASSRVTDVQLLQRRAPIEEPDAADIHRPAPLAVGQSHVQRIKDEGRLRVGIGRDVPPFSYRNDAGEPVGFDIDLIQRFAGELGVAVELVPAEWSELPGLFGADRIDVALGGLSSSIEHLGHFEESVAYLQTHIALVVPDHRVDEFKTVDQIRGSTGLRFAVYAGTDITRRLEVEFPQIETVQLEASRHEFLSGQRPDIDALITSAEIGSVLSMLYPSFSVVVPQGARRKFPLVVGVRGDAPELRRVLDTWIEIQQAEGTIDLLDRFWILGERSKTGRRRWSVARDVLGWFD